jgi:transcriptional regulator with XRE-family HTH domain|tara:strand:+ start:268 stop:483 length:216 start_codon:yes stop_codon:yes gene_type:complete
MSEVKEAISQGARKLVAWRTKEGYTLDKAAEVLGFDRYMLNRYENGVHKPQGKRAILIQNLCGVPIEAWYL